MDSASSGSKDQSNTRMEEKGAAVAGSSRSLTGAETELVKAALRPLLGQDVQLDECTWYLRIRAGYHYTNAVIQGVCSPRTAACPILSKKAGKPSIHGSNRMKFELSASNSSISLGCFDAECHASDKKWPRFSWNMSAADSVMMGRRNAADVVSQGARISTSNQVPAPDGMNIELVEPSVKPMQAPAELMSPPAELIAAPVGSARAEGEPIAMDMSSNSESDELEGAPVAAVAVAVAVAAPQAGVPADFNESDQPDWVLPLRSLGTPGLIDFACIHKAAELWCSDAAVVELASGTNVEAFEVERLVFMKELMNYLNRFWSVVTKLSKVVYVDRVQVNGTGGLARTEMVMRAKDAFHEAYANRKLELLTYERGVLQKVTRLLSELWLKSPLRCEYDLIECNPSPTASLRNLNLWQGMAITQVHCAAYRETHPQYQEEAAPFLDHVRNIWCKGNEACFNYVMGWFAMTIQKPQEKIGVALVVVGAPGAGKGVVVTDFLARIVGDHHYSHVMGIEQLLGRFSPSAALSNKLKLVDECTWAGRKEDAARLKTIITEDTAYVEKKFMDGMTVRSLSNLLIFSNDSFAVHVERKDRRFCSLETDNRFSGAQTAESRAYFKRLRAVPVEAVASVLYEKDLSSFHQREFPHTAFRQTQQIEAFVANSVEKWFMQCLDSEQLPGEGRWEERRSKSFVYQDYKQQAGVHAKAEHVFWKELSTMATYSTRQERQRGQTSVQLVLFDSLLACRAAFCTAMGAQEWAFGSTL